jgi:hypothetical protein
MADGSLEATISAALLVIFVLGMGATAARYLIGAIGLLVAVVQEYGARFVK